MIWVHTNTTADIEDVCRCVEPGWRKIILRLVYELRANDWDERLYQVKEKFGGLRFYIPESRSDLRDIIEGYKNDSVRTCEKCGQSGQVEIYRGWYKALCPPCLSNWIDKVNLAANKEYYGDSWGKA